MRARLILTIGLFGAIASMASRAATLPQFTVQVIEPPPPYTEFAALKVNNHGNMIAVGYDAQGLPHYSLWTADAGSVAIRTPDGTSITSIGGLNGHDVVIGTYLNGAFYWSQDRGSIAILPAPGYSAPHPNGVNDKAIVVGSVVASDGVTLQSFVWSESNGMQVMTPRKSSEALAINNSSHVAGNLIRKGGLRDEAAIWNGSKIVPLGFVGAKSATDVAGINDQDDVAVNAAIDNGSYTQAFIWTAKNGLRALSDQVDTTAMGIGKEKQIWGYAPGDPPYSFLWSRESGMENVANLLVPGSPSISSLTISDMSSDGVLAGWAIYQEVVCAVILTPIN